MQDRISLIHHHLFRSVIFSSLVLSLGCLAGGCGADQSTKVDTASQSVPVGVKNMQDNLKKQAALRKGASGKQQRPGPSGE